MNWKERMLLIVESASSPRKADSIQTMVDCLLERDDCYFIKAWDANINCESHREWEEIREMFIIASEVLDEEL